MYSVPRENETSSKPPDRREETGDESADYPRWDGSKTEFVSEEGGWDREQRTGIELSFVLKESEIYEFLKRSGGPGRGGRRFAPFVAALSVLTVVFLFAGLSTYRGGFYTAAVLCAAPALALGALPRLRRRAEARRSADGSRVCMTVYPDRIRVAGENGLLEVPLDGTTECGHVGGMLALYPAGDETGPVLLPLRCVSPRALPEIQAMLLAGTRPRK